MTTSPPDGFAPLSGEHEMIGPEEARLRLARAEEDLRAATAPHARVDLSDLFTMKRRVEERRSIVRLYVLCDRLAAGLAQESAALAAARQTTAEALRRGHAHHIEDVAVEADSVSQAWLLRCADEIRSGRVRPLPAATADCPPTGKG